MTDIFYEEETDGLLLVDAENAFNALNRSVLLHNIPYICPPWQNMLATVTTDHLDYSSLVELKYRQQRVRRKETPLQWRLMELA